MWGYSTKPIANHGGNQFSGCSFASESNGKREVPELKIK